MKWSSLCFAIMMPPSLMLLSACGEEEPAPLPQTTISGMASINETTALAVLNAKYIDQAKLAPRFAMVTADQAGQHTIQEINHDHVNWSQMRPAHDLAAICALSQQHFLAAESGYLQQGGKLQHGRLLLLTYSASKQSIEILGGWRYSHPFVDAQIEGLACQQNAIFETSFDVILGNRQSGQLYSATINIDPPPSHLPKLYETATGKIKLGYTTTDIAEQQLEERPIADLLFHQGILYGIASHTVNSATNGSAAAKGHTVAVNRSFLNPPLTGQTVTDQSFSTFYQTDITDLTDTGQGHLVQPNDILFHIEHTAVTAFTHQQSGQLLYASQHEQIDKRIQMIYIDKSIDSNTYRE